MVKPKIQETTFPLDLVYVAEALAMEGVKAWQLVQTVEVVQQCAAVEISNSHQCKLPQMLVLEVKLKAKDKAMISRDAVVPLDTTETRRGILKATGEINRLKVHNKTNQAKWETSKVSNNSKVTSSLVTAIGVP